MVVLGIGKSVVAAELFVRMKLMGYKVELITEYAKDLVYEQRQQTINDQIYIFGKMQHKINSVSNHVEYAIVYSPILLSLVYKKRISKLNCISDDIFKSLVLQVYNMFDNFDVLLKREDNSIFEQYGRLQNFEESLKIDEQINKCLNECVSKGVISIINYQNNFNKTIDEILKTLKIK